MRTQQPEFVVHKSPTPNGKRYWYIVGRPGGKRVRAWFNSEPEARKEADRRNQEMRKEPPPPAAKNGGKKTDAVDLPPMPVTAAMSEEIPTDELFESISRGLIKIREELLHLRKENNNLRLENDKLRLENNSNNLQQKNNHLLEDRIFKEMIKEPISFDDQDEW